MYIQRYLLRNTIVLQVVYSILAFGLAIGLLACGGGGGGSDASQPAPQPPPEIVCGQIITESTTLQADLVCSGDAPFAIEFGASLITLDLGGHSILQQTPVAGNYAEGVVAIDREGITVRNGTIEGFDEAVFLTRSDRATVSNMIFRNPRVVAVSTNLSDGVIIEHSRFELPLANIPISETNGIGVYGGFVHVSNIEVVDGMIGVAFGFPFVCDTAQSPSNGEVLNSTFTRVYSAPVYINCSTDLHIAHNQMTATIDGASIDADAPFFGAITGLLVENNTISNGFTGIVFSGATDSIISNNTVFDSQWFGIGMVETEGCVFPKPGWDCFYTTANLISGNTTSGSTPDLMHDLGSTGNNWVNNSCVTKEGADIPDC